MDRRTRRCSSRIRVSRPLLVSSRAWLSTVARKGRATRPAAERQRCGRHRYASKSCGRVASAAHVVVCGATRVCRDEA
jgi:hypothetical protein